MNVAPVPRVVEEQLKVQDVAGRGQPKCRVRHRTTAPFLLFLLVLEVLESRRIREDQALAAACKPGLSHDRWHLLLWQLKADLVARAEGHLGDALQDLVWQPAQRTRSSAPLNRAEQERDDLRLLHPVGAVLETTLHLLAQPEQLGELIVLP